MKTHEDKYSGKHKAIENFTSWWCRLNTICQLEVRINLLTASEKLCTEAILSYDCLSQLMWEKTGRGWRDEGKRETSPGCPSTKMWSAAFSSRQKGCYRNWDTTWWEERWEFSRMDGCEKPYCKDDLKKESIRLTMWVLRAWGDLCVTNVTRWARCKQAGWCLPRAWPCGAGGGRKAQHKSLLKIQRRAERPRKKGCGGWTCVSN